MSSQTLNKPNNFISSLKEMAELVDYSLMESLTPDPQATDDGEDHQPRQVFSGHYVPVQPTAIDEPFYITHSHAFFKELGLDDSLAQTDEFKQLFSGDMSNVPAPMKKFGWATGYALSIFGTEYIHQCPFQTGNGYGDGRAMSVYEGILNGKRWEMQLKGGGPTPYCRGADGRAVLRSSIREFLAQEHMHALGVPTSRSLSLFVSQSEGVRRPWYSEGSDSEDPDVMVLDPVAISTRVAPSFLRVGQLELFGRRARSNAHENALQELETIVLHAIEREYRDDIKPDLPMADKVIELALAFRERLTSLVANWLRVGYCQGNFNSDNCAVGGFTLDYGPFGFCEQFDPFFQPWTGGGRHFSFLNQTAAAEANFGSFCSALEPLLTEEPRALEQLERVRQEFSKVMEMKVEQMWAAKLGITSYDESLLVKMLQLMVQTSVDFNMFFRELSEIPKDVSFLELAFYKTPSNALREEWQQWLESWQSSLELSNPLDIKNTAEITKTMKQVNPKYTWREWLIVPAYQQARRGNFALIHELQEILAKPYEEQSSAIDNKYYQLRPEAFFEAGGVSHYSCSS